MEIKLEEDSKSTSVKVIKRIAVIAVFIALSAVGALIKIPSPWNTVALDSAAGFFSALAFGNLTGMLVIGIGHLLTSALSGFPLSLPIHLMVAIAMAVFAVLFRLTNKRLGIIPAIIAGIILNGLAAPFILLPGGGMVAVLAAIPFLLFGSAVNIIVAAIAYQSLKGTRLLKGDSD